MRKGGVHGGLGGSREAAYMRYWGRHRLGWRWGRQAKGGGQEGGLIVY